MLKYITESHLQYSMEDPLYMKLYHLQYTAPETPYTSFYQKN